MYRGTTMAGIIRDEARHDPEARLRRRLRDGDAVARPAVHGGVPRTRAAGAATSPRRMDRYDNMAGMWLVGEDMPQETNRVTLNADGEGQVRHCRCRTCTSTITPTTSPCATTPTSRARRSTRRSARPRTFPTPPYPSTHNLGTNRMSAEAEDGVVQQVRPDARHQEPVRLRRQPVHHRRRREPDADDRDAGDPPGRPHRAGDGGRARSDPSVGTSP